MSLRWFLPLYGVLWHLGLPLALAYLGWRGRRDPDYRRYLGERFGRYRQRMAGPVWIHAVSLGEFRSALPIARGLLDRGEGLVVTTMTPAGRREAERALAAEIAAGQAAVVWVPFETSWAYAGFFRSFRPRAGLVMEIEHWPRMILSAARAGVPLFPCNAQYPLKSFTADSTRRRWRFQLMAQYAGAMVKSDLQAARFRAAGLTRIEVTGETRFDQPIPPALLAAGQSLRLALPPRPVLVIASAVEGEDAVYLEALARLRAIGELPFTIYVPRRPERFDEVSATIAAAGFRLIRRSRALGPDLAPLAPIPPETEVLIGDSLGEMYGYLAAGDRAVVGGGFVPAGAHNIIEPLAMGLTVLTGPHVWTIEYPFAEAQAAGLAASVPDATALATALALPPPATADQALAFRAAHSGAAARTLAALDRLVPR